ncbi:alpha-2-macroglobulin family protein [Cupriavidus basilensis]
MAWPEAASACRGHTPVSCACAPTRKARASPGPPCARWRRYRWPRRCRRATALRVPPVEQAVAGKWSRGDSYRVKLQIDAQADMTWVVVSDPVPAGATILGSGLGRDSEIASRGEQRKGAWPAFTERTPQAFREYYAYMPRGSATVEYTVRLTQRRRVRVAAHAGGGDVRARCVRRATQCPN